MPKIYLTISHGSPTAHATLSAAHAKVTTWLATQSYGLPADVQELDEVGREMLVGLYGEAFPGEECLIDPPKSLEVGRLIFQLSSAPNLTKQTSNFLHLLTPDPPPPRGVNKKSLTYLSTPLHRFVPGFILQGGDVTRGDGSGGESIWGGTIPDPKPPHSKHTYGSLSYASGSSKNSSTSQFFISLCGPLPASSSMPPRTEQAEKESLARAKKLDGRYFPFAEMVGGWEVLTDLEGRLVADEEVGKGGGEGTGGRVWVSGGGVLED